jgi:hypothetical protein
MSTTPTTTSEPSISPSEKDLTTVLASLKNEHPALGTAKLHALLLSENLSWTVSEKRLRRILKSINASEPLTSPDIGPGPSSSSSSPGSEAAHRDAHVYPSSTLVEGLDVSRWTTAVEVKYFDKKKGKGLVAKEPISEGQLVWKEDPFIIAPEWWVYSRLRYFSSSYPDCFFFSTGRFTICSSRPEPAPTVPHPLQTTLRHSS